MSRLERRGKAWLDGGEFGGSWMCWSMMLGFGVSISGGVEGFGKGDDEPLGWGVVGLVFVVIGVDGVKWGGVGMYMKLGL